MLANSSTLYWTCVYYCVLLDVAVAQELLLLLKHVSVMCLSSRVFTACGETVSCRVAATHACLKIWGENVCA